MRNKFNISESEKNRIRNLHETEGENKKIDSSLLKEQNVLNDETVTNIISEGPLDGRGVVAKLCCSDSNLGYWQTNPTPSVITASNGNRGSMYINHHKMTINGNVPQLGQYFRAIESEGGSPTGNDPNGKSSGLIYRVTSVSAWNVGTTYNFPNASGCPSCPGITSWSCQVSGNQGTCTEVPGSNAPYATEQDCLTSGDPNCVGQGNSYFCYNGNCYQQQGTGGQYPDLPTCQAACGHEDKWECDNDTGQCYQDPNGQYSSQAACQAQCKRDKTWNCTSMGNCVAVNNNSGQYPTEQDCLNNCEQPTYDCKFVSGEPQGKVKPKDTRGKQVTLREQVNVSGYQCVPHPAPGTGQYPNLPACLAVCREEGPERNYCVNCADQVMSYYPGMSQNSQTECPPGFVDIGPNPSPPQGPCHECVNGNCLPGWSGPHNDMAACVQVCSQQLWECIVPGQQCSQTTNGTHATQALCNAACIVTSNWKCTAGPQGCIQDPAGPFTTEQDCIDDCCAGQITNWNWGPMPSPNCNQVCAKLNTGAMVAIANNTSTNFIHQCRYDWLIAQGCDCTGVNSCCGGSQYLSSTLPVAQQTVAYGACITDTPFVEMIENAMRGDNAQNTPYGCGWLQVVRDGILTGGNNNLATATAASTICSLTGRLVWIDNLMSTGTAYNYNPTYFAPAAPNGATPGNPTPNLSTPC